MQFSGEILMGAQGRLLPPSVPYRFFVAAAIFHAVWWAMITAAAGGAAGFTGGPGLVSSAIHALTLGVLVMTAMGASFQLLPVATGQPLKAIWPCKLVSWLYMPGAAMLLYGFAAADRHFMAGGGLMVILAMLVFGFLAGDVLRRAKSRLKLLVIHGFGSLVSLFLLAALGFAMIADQEHGFLPASVNFRLAHMALAVYGFMGMLAVGYSQVLVPMFALSAAPDEKQGVAAFALFAAALALAMGGIFSGAGYLLALAAIAAMGISLFHVFTMMLVLRRGMRKNLGLSFVLIKTAWAFLPLGLAFGALELGGFLDGRGILLFGFASIVGWLLTFLLGVLQRIIPFLAAMNASKEGQIPPRLSELANEAPLKAHAACHFTALALIMGGALLVREPAILEPVIMAGGLIGLCGALAFLWFTLDVLRRMRGYSKRLAGNENKTTVQYDNGAIQS